MEKRSSIWSYWNISLYQLKKNKQILVDLQNGIIIQVECIFVDIFTIVR